MAAFLQKLFKSRKPAAPTRKTPARAQPTAVPAEDKRAEQKNELREEQLQALQASPTQNVAAGLANEGVTADIRFRAANLLQDAELL